MPEDYTPFSQIVTELARLSSARATGTLFVATDANRSAQVMLKKGEIIYLSYANKRGDDALDLIPSITAGRYRFQEGEVSANRMRLPATATILKRLAQHDALAAPASQSADADPSLEAAGLTQHQRNMLQDCLAEFVGPIAALVCEEQLEQARDLQSAIDALSAEISSPDLAQEFQTLVLSRLS